MSYKIYNVILSEVTAVESKRGLLGAKITFSFFQLGSIKNFEIMFDLDDPDDNRRVIELMKYTKVKSFSDLINRVVRVVWKDDKLHGFGHPIKPEFITYTTPELLFIAESEISTKLFGEKK